MGRITETHAAIAIVTIVTVNVRGETNLPVTLLHGRKKGEVNFQLMGLRLRKCIELRDN